MVIDNKRWGILYCPKGSTIRPNKRWERVEKALRDNNIDYDYVQSENTGSVERLIKMFTNSGYETIVIVGGDSALNDAVNCLMQIDSEKRKKISIGLIPNGVMNDFAHFWYMREDDEDRLIRSFKRKRIKKIDLGCIRYHNKYGEPCRRYFLNCVNVGFIAAIMNIRRKTRHLLKSRTLSFLFSFVLMIFQRPDYKMHIKINTDEVKRKVMTVCVGNALGYGQTPNAVPYNGQLDVSVVFHSEMTQLFDGIYLFLKGKFLNHRNVSPYRTKKVEFLDAEYAMVGIDGRLMKTPKGPFTIFIEPEVINFLLPD
ncbi:MAG: diacylglycerol kinase family protein [Prevotella sp.]